MSEPAPPALSVIVVHYATPELLRDCLASLAAERARADCPAGEVLVIDNASPDDAGARVAREFPDCALLVNPINVGFSRAVNQGCRRARGRYFLILNADIRVAPGALAALVGYLDAHPEAGLCAPQLLNPDGSLQESCRRFYTLRAVLLRRTPLGRLFPDSPALRAHLYRDYDHAAPRAVDWVLGAAMCVRAAAWAQVGPFDERYFLYLEDVDYCLRLQRAGFAVVYVPQAVMVHHHLQASRRGWFNRDVLTHVASTLRFYDKWSQSLARLRRTLAAVGAAVMAACDVVLLAACLRGAYAVRAGSADWFAQPLTPLTTFERPFAVFGVLMVLVLAWQGLYRLERDRDTATLVSQAIKAAALAAVGTLVVGLWQGAYVVGYPYSRAVLALFAALAALALGGYRVVLVNTLRWLGRKRLVQKRTLIVGAGETARALGRELSRFPGVGYELVGLLAPDATECGVWSAECGVLTPAGARPAPSALRPPPSAIAAVPAPLDALPALVARERIGEVIFTDLDRYYERAIGPLLRLQEAPVDVKVVLAEFSTAVLTSADTFFGFPVLRFDRHPWRPVARALKRLLDLAGALVLLAAAVVLTPVWAWLRGRRGGPLFEVRTVHGRQGRPLRLWGLRRAPEETAPWLELLLRRFNLDKLPLALAVLGGGLSLVGPRPLEPAEWAALEPWQRARLHVRPGITGWWQVHRERLARFSEMVRLDLFYVQNWSLLLDLRILLTSATIILRGRAVHRGARY